MKPDLLVDASLILAGVGGGLQFLRQFGRLKDRWVISLSLLSCALLWVFMADWTLASDNWQKFGLEGAKAMTHFCTSLFGGMFAMAKTAVGMVKLGANPDHLLVPVTDSK